MSPKALEVYRIVTLKRREGVFSGEGARLYGGRWNPRGVRIVYTASSRALAILEMLVQDQPLRARYAIIPATIPALVRVGYVTEETLPKGWASTTHAEEFHAIGADWVKRGATAVLRVPSAVVPSEFNFLLNPAHPDFQRIKQEPAETLNTDRRLAQRLARTTGR